MFNIAGPAVPAYKKVSKLSKKFTGTSLTSKNRWMINRI